ncbi:MAG: hypothetical protein ACRECY_06880 [Phyllobacterium sp.]
MTQMVKRHRQGEHNRTGQVLRPDANPAGAGARLAAGMAPAAPW